MNAPTIFLLLISGLFLLATTTRGQEDAGIATLTVQEQAGLAKEKKRLLHLENGQILRGKARLNGTSWEIARRKEWIPIPAAGVIRVENERDVLKEAKARYKLAKKSDLASRAQYVDWMTGEGLYQESYDELEKILTKDPDQEPGKHAFFTAPTDNISERIRFFRLLFLAVLVSRDSGNLPDEQRDRR